MHYRRPNAGVSVTTSSALFSNRYEVETLKDNALIDETSFTRSESLPSSVQDI